MVEDGARRLADKQTTSPELPTGFQDFGMVAISAPELAAYFPGFEENGVNTCRFRNCRHRSEPRCAVIARVEQGLVAAERYRTYLELLDEVEASAIDDRQRSWQD